MQGRGAGGEELEGARAVVGYVGGVEAGEGDGAVVGEEVRGGPFWGVGAAGGTEGQVLGLGEVEIWVGVEGEGIGGWG